MQTIFLYLNIYKILIKEMNIVQKNTNIFKNICFF